MSKSIYIRAFSNTNQDKCLEAAETCMKALGLKAKDFYFPKCPNERGYYSVLIRVPEGMSELGLRAKISWVLGEESC